MSSLLDKINSPQDLKALRIDDLYKLSEEIRSFIIRTVALNRRTSGIKSGVVEHYCPALSFECPEDKIIWDVESMLYS